MTEKIIVTHDVAVYQALKKQAAFNRKMQIFAFAVVGYLLVKDQQERKQKREAENQEGE